MVLKQAAQFGSTTDLKFLLELILPLEPAAMEDLDRLLHDALLIKQTERVLHVGSERRDTLEPHPLI